MAKKSKIMVAEAAPASYKQSKEDLERQRRYEAEDAMRTLTRAEEIRNDKGLMGRVKSIAKEQMKTAAKFAK